MWETVIVIAILIAVLGLALWHGTPYFQAIFERSDRDTVIDNKVITPPGATPHAANRAEAIQQAEEAGTLGDDGLPTH